MHACRRRGGQMHACCRRGGQMHACCRRAGQMHAWVLKRENAGSGSHVSSVLARLELPKASQPLTRGPY
eukprot:358515-Chlamydomonas_euryale.AAC.1